MCAFAQLRATSLLGVFAAPLFAIGYLLSRDPLLFVIPAVCALGAIGLVIASDTARIAYPWTYRGCVVALAVCAVLAAALTPWTAELAATIRSTGSLVIAVLAWRALVVMSPQRAAALGAVALLFELAWLAYGIVQPYCALPGIAFASFILLASLYAFDEDKTLPAARVR